MTGKDRERVALRGLAVFLLLTRHDFMDICSILFIDT